MSQAANIEKMEKARRASIAEAALGPYLSDHEESIIAKAVATYRAGKLEPVAALATIAEISALRAVVSSFTYDQRSGDIAAEREFNNGP
jgi:hypothetical protein